jgi:hypothetical protein
MGNRKTRLDNNGGNMGLKKILFFGRQIGLQADFFVPDAWIPYFSKHLL